MCRRIGASGSTNDAVCVLEALALAGRGEHGQRHEIGTVRVPRLVVFFLVVFFLGLLRRIDDVNGRRLDTSLACVVLLIPAQENQ